MFLSQTDKSACGWVGGKEKVQAAERKDHFPNKLKRELAVFIISPI